MKWISQHIYDFVSRFRNDVYLENLSTTTETSALVVDSNGKVSKNTTSGVNMTNGADNRVVTAVGTSGLNAETYLSFENTGDVSSLAIISNLDPPNDYFLIQTSAHGATTISTVDDDATAAHLTLQPDGNIVLDPASQAITADAYLLSLTSSTAGPYIQCRNDVNDGAGGYLELSNYRDSNGLNDGDVLGVVQFSGTDAAGNYQIYSRIIGDVIESDHGSETGKLEFKVAEYDGTLTTGLAVLGTTTDGRVDVTMGTLSTSVVTIAGSLTMGVTSTINSSGVIQVATQGIIDHDSLANFVANEHIDWTGDVSASSVIHTNNITDLHGAGVDGSANQLLTDDGDGTVTSESGATWDGSTLGLTSVNTGCAALTLTATADGNKPTNFSFIKNRASSTAAADDLIGFTSWISDNASGTAKYYAEQYVQAAGVVAGDEFARVIHTCATSTGTVSSRQNMITGLGSASANTVNTTLGYGVESTCTIAGDVVLQGDSIRVAGSSTQSGRISLSEDTDNGSDMVTLAGPAATSGQTITLPDATGTVALTSDIVSGWHGSTTRIKILHSDFIISDTGRPYMIDDSGIGAEKLFGETNSTAPCFVTVAIPTGYDATHVMIYGNGTSAVEVWEHQISDKLGVSKGTGNIGTEINITDVTSSATNYLFILVEQGSGEEIYGGYVTVAAT